MKNLFKRSKKKVTPTVDNVILSEHFDGGYDVYVNNEVIARYNDTLLFAHAELKKLLNIEKLNLIFWTNDYFGEKVWKCTK